MVAYVHAQYVVWDWFVFKAGKKKFHLILPLNVNCYLTVIAVHVKFICEFIYHALILFLLFL